MPPRLRAEIHGPLEIRFTLSGAPEGFGAEGGCSAGAFRLTDGQGGPLPIGDVLLSPPDGGAATTGAHGREGGSGQTVLLPGDSSGQVVPASPLDPLRVHYLEIPALGARALVRRDPLFRAMRSDKPLGARVAVDGSQTAFRVFSPRASAVRLYLYRNADDLPAQALRVVLLERDADGVWEATIPGDLHGTWYDFTVHGPDDPGNWFYEQSPAHPSDPYALVNDDALGKSRVWRDGLPPPPVAGGRPRMEDVVAYEVHVQDFTDLLPTAEHETGTLPAMARGGLHNVHGEPVGFDHLASLGVNVVHLMPVQEYLHYPDSAWRAAFAADPFAQAMGIDRENYQWGYRTTHAFAVESRYRSRDAEPGAERDQFRALVQAFHERGIAVIVDLVPNHTGEDMDREHRLLHFNVFDLPYHYRTDEVEEHIGPFGNEVKTEERPMVQRWLLDQMRHWVEALGVDGFRIDLAGQIDRGTLEWVKRELPADLIIYGEPWIAPSDPDVRANPEWAWYKHNAPITFFQDDARNAFQGSPFDVRDRGWAGGDGWKRDAAMAALANHYAEERLSTQGISYLDIHDNWALADRYALRDQNGLLGVDLGAVRIAAGLLLTSVGPVVVHGGTEMLRSKGLAPLEERTVRVGEATVAFRGRHDSYNLRAPNRFVWNDLAPGCTHSAMRDWWRGLIALRMSDHGRVFRTARVPEGHYRWITPEDRHLLGYVVGERVLVLANSGRRHGLFDVALPAGRWRQVADGERVDLSGVGGDHGRIEAGDHPMAVPGGAFLVWVRES